jgi:hypothetical protein
LKYRRAESRAGGRDRNKQKKGLELVNSSNPVVLHALHDGVAHHVLVGATVERPFFRRLRRAVNHIVVEADEFVKPIRKNLDAELACILLNFFVYRFFNFEVRKS